MMSVGCLAGNIFSDRCHQTQPPVRVHPKCREFSVRHTLNSPLCCAVGEHEYRGGIHVRTFCADEPAGESVRVLPAASRGTDLSGHHDESRRRVDLLVQPTSHRSGSYAQCDSALRSAQTQNLIFGWWSFFSILILNWVTLLHNSNARKRLNRDAQQAREYALWWHTYVGTNQR